MKNVLFITSLEFSGSTILEIMLGMRKGFAGMGEPHGLYQILRAEKNIEEYLAKRYCSCGTNITNCDYWMEFFKCFDAKKIETYEEYFGHLYSYFHEHFDEETWMIDNSKQLQALQTTDAITEDMKVLFLVKDVRSWAYSVMNREEGRSFEELQDRWLRNNERILSYLIEQEIPYIPISYEEFCRQKEQIISEIVSFVKGDAILEELPETQSHSIMSNGAAIRGSRERGLVYDTRWISDARVAKEVKPEVWEFVERFKA